MSVPSDTRMAVRDMDVGEGVVDTRSTLVPDATSSSKLTVVLPSAAGVMKVGAGKKNHVYRKNDCYI